MSTSSGTSNPAHTSDATFQAWIQEVDGYMLATGLIAASDTGQLNLASAVRPAASTVAGFRIYKTDDGLATIYIKLSFGTNANALYPRVEISVADGTNGAGTLTGNIIGPFINSAQALGGVAKTSYASGVSGSWWVAYAPGGIASLYPLFAFALYRFADITGAPTSGGFVLYYWTGFAASTQQVTLLPTASTQTASKNVCMLPSSITAGGIGSDIQFWKHYTAQPKMTTNPFVLTCDGLAVADGTMKTISVAGSSRTYINPGLKAFNNYGIGAISGNHGLMLVWQ